MTDTSFRAAIFDMDGVLIDTVLLHWEAYNEVLFEKYGKKVTQSQLTGLIGMTLDQQIPLLNDMFKITIDSETFIPEANKRKELKMAQLAPKEGVVDFLRDLHDNHIKLGVGTSTSEVVAKDLLTNIGIVHFFDCIVGEESVVKHKPDPEVYITVAKQLGVEPDRCIVFEDAPKGVSAGVRAGMKVVAIQTSYVPSSELEAANVTIPSFNGVDLATINSLLDKKQPI